MTSLAQIFSPERVRAGFANARRSADGARPADLASSSAAKTWERVMAVANALPGPGARAVVALLGELAGLAARAEAAPEAGELLDRIEDLVYAIELGGGESP